MNSRNIRPQAVNLVECVKWSVSAAGGRRPPKHKSLSAVYAAHICCSKRLSPCAASSMLFMSARHSLICCWRRRSCSKTLSPSAQLVLFFNLRRRECQGEDPATWNRTCGLHWTYHTCTLKNDRLHVHEITQFLPTTNTTSQSRLAQRQWRFVSLVIIIPRQSLCCWRAILI